MKYLPRNEVRGTYLVQAERDVILTRRVFRVSPLQRCDWLERRETSIRQGPAAAGPLAEDPRCACAAAISGALRGNIS